MMQPPACDRSIHCWRGVVVAFLLASATGNPGAAVADGSNQPRSAPLISAPSATLAPNGTFFASLSGTTRRGPGATDVDGSAALGFGLGNAEDGVGIQVSAHITSLITTFGDSGYLAVKLSRRIESGPAITYVGATIDHLARWGDARLRDTAYTLAVTRFSTFTAGNGRSYPIVLSVGAGTRLANRQRDPGAFIGAGVGLTRSLGIGASYVGDAVDIGAAVTPPSLPNIAMSATLVDAFNMNDNRKVTISVSWVLRDLFGR